MNYELKKTFGFVVVALVLAGAAFVKIPDRTGKDAEFSDLGKRFFPEFNDPNACTSLEVIEYDPATTFVSPFKVLFKDGRWTIPSHADYPADGKDRLAQTAAGVIDLTKDTIRSDRLEDQEALGVIDPFDTKFKDRGKRVTLKDASDKVLADLIIGNEVKGRPGQRYVRVPSQKRVYGVNVKLDLSTRFPDWIESNLLKVDVAKVRKVAFDSNKFEVDGRSAVLVPGEILTIERKDASTSWSLAGAPIPPGKELDAEKLSGLISALGDLKIVDVRRKPEGLTRELKATGDVLELTSRSDRSSLINHGYVPDAQGRVVSNQGEVDVSTEDGAVYILRFGDAAIVGGESAPESASAESAKKDEAAKKEKDKKAGGIESRYLLVTVAFDPNLLPPLPDPDAGRPLELPADVFHHEPGSPEKLAEEKVAGEKLAKRRAEEEKRIAEAEAKVKELSDRFAAWYYLTPNEAFRSLALGRNTLIRDKSAKPSPGDDGPSGFPGMPNMPGFPPGGPGRRPPINPHGG